MKDKEPPQDLLDWMGVKNAPNWVGARSFGRLIGTLLVVAVPALFAGSLIAAFVVLWHTVDLAINGEGGAINLGAGALITALLGAPFLIWSTVLKHQTVRYQKEGHITDRINKAVEQLGTEKSVKRDGEETTVPNIEVRIGAILSLERIAQDSTRYDKGRDHVRVMEILCAYVRENAPADKAKFGNFPPGCNQSDLEKKLAESPYDWLSKLKRPRSDVLLAILVIGRRSKEQILKETNYTDGKGKGYTLDLSNSCLRKGNFEGLNFSNANFYKSLLEGAYCQDADFSGSNFIYAGLTGINGSRSKFSGARVQMADLSYANLDHADFTDCIFSHTHLVRTDFENATFRFENNDKGRNLNRAFFILSDLRNAELKGDLIGVIFHYPLSEDKGYPRELIHARFRNARVSFECDFLGRPKVYKFGSLHWLKVTYGDASVGVDEDFRPAHWPDWVLPDEGPHSFNTEYQKWRANPNTYTPPPKPEG